MQSTTETIQLHDGNHMPVVGIGTSPLQGRESIEYIVNAITAGYRMIDTAQQYNNETSIAEGIKLSGIDRRELFITTKVAGINQGTALTKRSIEDSLTRLNTDYLDLVLIHWPNTRQGLMVQTWEALIACKHKGMVKSIGVSNFLPEHLDELGDATMVMPVVNQVQVDPYLQRVTLREELAKRKIVTQSWGPFAARAYAHHAANPTSFFDSQRLDDIAFDAGLTTQALMLAWLRAEGIVVIPRSVNPERQAANLQAASIELEPSIIERVRAIQPYGHHVYDPHTHEEW